MTGALFAGLLPVVLDLVSLLGIAIGALGSLVVVAAIAVYLLRNRPRTFLSLRKLRPEPDRDHDRDREYDLDRDYNPDHDLDQDPGRDRDHDLDRRDLRRELNEE